MNYPGELSNIINEQKYINFNQFILAVKKVFNYKFDLIPLFITLKRALKSKRHEKILKIKERNCPEYAQIGNELCNEFKKEGEIGESIYDFKKNLKIIKRIKLNDQNSNVITVSNSPAQNYKIMNHNKKKNSKYKGIRHNSYYKFTEELTKSNWNDGIYSINYNKICGFEVFPRQYRQELNPRLATEDSTRFTTNPGYKPHPTHNSNIRSTYYMTSKEILEEIIQLSNKHKISDECAEDLLKIGKEVNKIRKDTRVVLKPEPGPINMKGLTYEKVSINTLKGVNKKNKKDIKYNSY
jgi:hypothetical protein